MTHIKLPAGYEDWVEVSPTPEGEYVKVEVIHWTPLGRGGHAGMPIEKLRYFVPPKPKPVLPEVKAGAVIRFTHKSYGTTVQAVKWRTGSDWHIQFGGVGRGLCETYCGDAWLLENVDANGFTVELEGL